jgi:hypothetical protein
MTKRKAVDTVIEQPTVATKRKTIDASTVRKIAAEIDCSLNTVYKVFETRKARYTVSRKVLAALVRSGHLPAECLNALE